LLGGHIGDEQVHFGDKAGRLPAKAAPEAVIRLVRRFVDEREAGEAFRSWMDRSGGASALQASLKDLDSFPLPADDPDFFVDWDETAGFNVELGASECA
jgi:sulfite reductase (ferredoxin)